eukprot:CAMPEP_0168754034 /NCGR_PEP_ID=MMETSP0724-20121128/19283_1 /TAXON_ID=265536 /ORGANISM="Amphiprora sp., Strain CCMP467" /LENGTH=248 /DNA_ID=CAMNT_0008802481 /DNA_START=10 /DNA_END=756 /DNA_ORIENTATION=-
MSSQTESCESIPLNNLITEVAVRGGGGGGDSSGPTQVSSLSMSFDMSADSQASFFHMPVGSSAMEQLKQDGVHDVRPRIPRQKSQVSFTVTMGSASGSEEEEKESTENSRSTRRSRQRSMTRALRKSKRPVKKSDRNESLAEIDGETSLCLGVDGDDSFERPRLAAVARPTSVRQNSSDTPPKHPNRSESLQSLNFMLLPGHNSKNDETETTTALEPLASDTIDSTHLPQAPQQLKENENPTAVNTPH